MSCGSVENGTNLGLFLGRYRSRNRSIPISIAVSILKSLPNFVQFRSVRKQCQIFGLLPDVYCFRPEISRISQSNAVSLSNSLIFARQGGWVRYKKNAAELTSAAHPYIPKHIPERNINPVESIHASTFNTLDRSPIDSFKFGSTAR